MNTAIENAIHTELVSASGLAGGRIIYEYQSRPALEKSGGSREFMTIQTTVDHAIAPATPQDTQRDNPSSTLGDGAELLVGTVADVEFTVRCTYYAGAARGDASAYGRLRSVVRKLGLPSVPVRLALVGVAFIEASGDVRSVPQVLETEYESRAVVDLRFRAVEALEETETFIQTAEFTATLT